MADFTYEVHDDGVAVVTWDVPGKSMNVLTREAPLAPESMMAEHNPWQSRRMDPIREDSRR